MTRKISFMGYVPANEQLYLLLRQSDYTLIFKPVVYNHAGTVKGNVDAQLEKKLGYK